MVTIVKRVSVAGYIAVAFSLGPVVRSGAQTPAELDGWETTNACRLEVDCVGLRNPVALAFVPQPGSEPEDPLYFVAERGGRIQVVTNNRTVHVFTDGLRFPPGPEPGGAAEIHDICLAADEGYLFASVLASTPRGNRGGILRFDCKRVTMSTTPLRVVSLHRSLDREFGLDDAHIGPIVVHHGSLFAGIANHRSPSLSRDADSALGKIVRMSFEGCPHPANPLRDSERLGGAGPYVYSLGLRWPRGIAFAGDDLLVTDDGFGFDRLVRAGIGRDCLYDGTSLSLGVGVECVFGPRVDAMSMCYVPPDAAATAAELCDGLLVVLPSTPGHLDSGRHGACSVVSIPIRNPGRSVDVPVPLLTYTGRDDVIPTAVEVGPDGVYVATSSRTPGTSCAVLKITSAPEHRCSTRVVGSSASTFMASRGCFECHTNDIGATYARAPSLDPDLLFVRLMRRLHSSEYLAQLIATDRSVEPEIAALAYARRDVREATGSERIRAWLRYKLVEPRFDDADSTVPAHGLNGEQAAMVANELLAELPHSQDLGILDRVRLVVADLVPHPRQRHLLLFLCIGGLLGGVLTHALLAFRRRVRAERPSRP